MLLQEIEHFKFKLFVVHRRLLDLSLASTYGLILTQVSSNSFILGLKCIKQFILSYLYIPTNTVHVRDLQWTNDIWNSQYNDEELNIAPVHHQAPNLSSSEIIFWELKFTTITHYLCCINLNDSSLFHGPYGHTIQWYYSAISQLMFDRHLSRQNKQFFVCYEQRSQQKKYHCSKCWFKDL